MEQMNLFSVSLPYRYIIDASSIFSQKPNEPHRRTVYRSQWENIDDYIKLKIVVTCSEIKEEIKDNDIKKWLAEQQCVILDVDDEIQRSVRRIVTQHPKLVDFGKVKSSGDAFLIATAMKYNLTVITEENKEKLNKIPNICEYYSIPCVNITELCEAEDWKF